VTTADAVGAPPVYNLSRRLRGQTPRPCDDEGFTERGRDSIALDHYITWHACLSELLFGALFLPACFISKTPGGIQLENLK
jgi:hypothetical protein